MTGTLGHSGRKGWGVWRDVVEGEVEAEWRIGALGHGGEKN